MKRLALALALLPGCAASPLTMPGFVDPQTTGRGSASGDLRASGLSGSGVAAGSVVRVAPRIDERWSVPVEGGAHLGVSAGALSYATLRLGVRSQASSGLVLGGGLVGHGVRRIGALGLGGGADVEVGVARSWNRWALSFIARPGISATALSVPTVWVPGEIAVAYRLRPHVSIYAAAHAAGGVAFAGPFGLLVSGGGIAVGVSGRWGVR